MEGDILRTLFLLRHGIANLYPVVAVHAERAVGEAVIKEECRLADLPQKNRRQNGDEIKDGDDEDAEAGLVDPFVAEIPFVPVGRFDETANTCGQAESGTSPVILKPGLSDHPGRNNGRGGLHVWILSEM
jgi:hypothetical protein